MLVRAAVTARRVTVLTDDEAPRIRGANIDKLPDWIRRQRNDRQPDYPTS